MLEGVKKKEFDLSYLSHDADKTDADVPRKINNSTMKQYRGMKHFNCQRKRFNLSSSVSISKKFPGELT